MRVDVHQHLWSEPLVSALSARRLPPRVRRGHDGWWLDLAGEAPCPLALDDVDARAALVRADGLDRALVALSGPLGVESLHPDDAAPAPGGPPHPRLPLPARGGPRPGAFPPPLSSGPPSRGRWMTAGRPGVGGVHQLVWGSARPGVEPPAAPLVGPATWDALV